MVAVREVEPGVFTTDFPAGETLVNDDGDVQASLATILHQSWTPAERAKFGVFLVDSAPIPEGKQVLSSRFERDAKGVVKEIVELTDEIPGGVTPRQLQLALLNANRLDDVEAFIAGLDRGVKGQRAAAIAWEYAIEYRREDPMLNQMATLLGMTSEEVDQIFKAAAAL